MPDQPNLLVLMTDQQSATAMSCAGNTDLHTPHLDRLAELGVRFDRAHAALPLCGPQRASLVTGRYPSENGCMTNAATLAPVDVERSMGRLMRAAGYDTAYGGKWHVSHDGAPHHDLTRAGEAFGFECVCGFNDAELPAACRRYLARDHARPFLLIASFDNPHNICEHSRDQMLPWGEVLDAPPDGYPNLPANAAPPAYEARVLDGYRQQYPPAQHGYDADRWRRYRHVYHRLCEKVDAQIGEVLRGLDDAGLTERTVIVFHSDHGDQAGAHGLVQKSVSYDESVRVPFVVCDPRAAAGAGGRVEHRLVNTGVDLLPTLLDYAGAERPGWLSGVSVRPAVEEADAAPREAVFLQGRLDATDIAWRGVRTERFKYSLYSRGANREMLFDIESDPGEMVNLAVEARHRPELDRHRRLLYGHCLAIGDAFGSHHTHEPHPVIPGIGFTQATPRAGAEPA